MSNYTREKVWSIKVNILRILWHFFYISFFRFSPRFLWSFRNFLLILFGTKLGKGVRISNKAKISFPWNISIGSGSSIGDYVILYPLGFIEIGKHVTVSQYSHLCAGSHNMRLKSLPLIKTKIIIKDYVWCCSNVFIGPSAILEKFCVVTPGSVFKGSSEEAGIYTGNIAKLQSFRRLESE